MLNREERDRILLLFSDVNSSPQLVEIVKRLRISQNTFRVVLIGDADLDISREMRKLSIPFSLISKRSKYGSLIMLYSVGREVFSFKPKAILASGQYATIIGMFSAYVLKVPRRIFIRHHSNFHYRYHMRFGIWMDRVANYLSTDIVAVSQVVRGILTNIEGVRPGKITLIHNGVDIRKFSSAVSKQVKASPARHDEIRIGIVSRFTEWKGIQYSVEAYIRLRAVYPNSHLYLIGARADSYRSITEQLSTLESSSYTVSEWNSDVLSFLGSLDIFVHAPIGPEDEAFGLVYIEALASHIPCIFTLSGVLHELPNVGRYAEIVPYEDSSAIYDSAMKILASTPFKREFVPQEWLEQFSLDIMADRYRGLILGTGVYEAK